MANYSQAFNSQYPKIVEHQVLAIQAPFLHKDVIGSVFKRQYNGHIK